MKYYLECQIPNYRYRVRTNEYCLTFDNAINYIDDIIYDFIRDTFFVEEDEIIGVFDEYDLREKIYLNAIKLIQSVNSNLYFISSVEVEQTAKTIRRTIISVREYTYQRVEELREDSSFDELIAHIVEEKLFGFLGHSVWHIGLRNMDENEIEIVGGRMDIGWTEEYNWIFKGKLYYPIVWFGPSGYPSIPEWRISRFTEEKEFAFWFCTDEKEVIKYLVREATDRFITWYTAVCKCLVPDIQGIRNMCPVPIENGDTVSDYIEKIDQYIIDHMV